MKLHKLTVEVLYHKAQEGRIADACLAAVETGTPEGMSHEAQYALSNYLEQDLPANETTAIVRDLCRAGWYEKHNPNSSTWQRIKTRIIDGVKYVTGI